MSPSASGSVSRHCTLVGPRSSPVRVPYSPRVSMSVTGRCVATSPCVVLVTRVARLRFASSPHGAREVCYLKGFGCIHARILRLFSVLYHLHFPI